MFLLSESTSRRALQEKVWASSIDNNPRVLMTRVPRNIFVTRAFDEQNPPSLTRVKKSLVSTVFPCFYSSSLYLYQIVLCGAQI